MSLTWIELRWEPRELDGGETLILGPRQRSDLYIYGGEIHPDMDGSEVGL